MNENNTPPSGFDPTEHPNLTDAQLLRVPELLPVADRAQLGVLMVRADLLAMRQWQYEASIQFYADKNGNGIGLVLILDATDGPERCVSVIPPSDYDCATLPEQTAHTLRRLISQLEQSRTGKPS